MDPFALDTERLVAETFLAAAEHHAQLTSTNDLARLAAGDRGRALPLAIVADRQTAGRGRGSHRWWTGAGSLAVSLVLEADSTLSEQGKLPLLGLAVAVAVVHTVEPLLPDHAVALHWPNDVMAGGRKLAGILVEVPGNRRPILGIGLNTNNRMADAPETLRGTGITLRDLTGRDHDHTELLIGLLGHLQRWLGRLKESPEEVGAEADRLCGQRGQVLRLRCGKDLFSGRCAGIAADGALLLEADAGLSQFYSGTLI